MDGKIFTVSRAIVIHIAKIAIAYRTVFRVRVVDTDVRRSL